MIKEFRQFDLFGHRTFVKAIIAPPFRMLAEMENEACFYFVLKGEAGVVSHNQAVRLIASEGLVMQCGNYLNDYICDNKLNYCEAIAIHLREDVLRDIYDKEFPDFLLNVKNIQPITLDKLKASVLLNKYIDSLLFYFENPELVTEELLKLKLKELILLLAKTDNAEAIQSLIKGLFNKSSIDFKKTIEQNIYSNYKLEELASLTQLSLSSFKREFQKQYHSSPAKYIRERKLDKAAKLLTNTSLRVSNIAFDVGFSDMPNFSRLFQKTYGMAPSAYRLAN